MKWFILIATLTILLSCKQSETTIIATPTSPTVAKTETVPLKEALFISMERTPCFGQCPSYKITIMNTGKVTFEGKKFIKPLGFHTKKISTQQLSQLQERIETIELFEMQSKYDSKVTDLPAVALLISYKGEKKKIYNRIGGPVDLREFEKLIDTIVIDDQLKRLEIRD